MSEEIKKDKTTIPPQSTPSNKPSTTPKPNIKNDGVEILQDSNNDIINLSNKKSFKPIATMRETTNTKPSDK